jgi:hypothetical protein
MEVKLSASAGPISGQEITLKEGMKIGRDKGDIRLKDAKVSSLHAFVVADATGELLIKDNGSKNGLKLNGERVLEAPLRMGSIIEIGRSRFEVKEIIGAQVQAPSEAATRQAIAIPEEDRPGSRRWNELLAELALDAAAGLVTKASEPRPFSPPLRMTFIGGLQAETQWLLGYGPRKAGAKSVDLPIFEPSAPDTCFELVPEELGATFRTSHPAKIKINGQALSVRVLKPGDVIAIGDTRIEVEWHE